MLPLCSSLPSINELCVSVICNAHCTFSDVSIDLLFQAELEIGISSVSTPIISLSVAFIYVILTIVYDADFSFILS